MAGRIPSTALGEAARDAVALAEGAVALLTGAHDLAALCRELRDQVERADAIVAVDGARRGDALFTLVRQAGGPVTVGPGVRIVARAGAALSFEARWPDGRREGPPVSRVDERAAALSLLERAISDEESQVRAAAERHAAAAARAASDAAAGLATANAPGLAAVVALPRPETTPARTSRVLALWLWLVALLRSFFGRKPAPALPPVDAAEAARTAAAEAARTAARRLTTARERREESAGAVAAAARELETARARLAKLAAERDQRRRALEDERTGQDRRLVQRLRTLLAPGGAREVELTAPALPPGIVVLLRAEADLYREPADAVIAVDDEAAVAGVTAALERVCERRPADIARRVAGLVCSCRNQIVDVAERARLASEARLGELAARRIAAPSDFAAHAVATAQLPLARGAEQIVDEAATQLERLVDEARQAWEQRIDSCAGLEQLRAEVAAIENGAAHRLSLVCDELRETITVRLVRHVLELSRPVRQELLRKRLEVARGRSPKADETFDDVRVTLPSELDKAFATLRAPAIGALLSTERGFFDPVFRTLAREKRECTSRLRARLDEVAQTTARDLYAATVYVTPLLQATFRGLVDELNTGHERWLEARATEERRGWDDERARLQPALDLVDPLAQREQQLARLLEETRGAAARDAG
jgi:hypothetical protein